MDRDDIRKVEEVLTEMAGDENAAKYLEVLENALVPLLENLKRMDEKKDNKKRLGLDTSGDNVDIVKTIHSTHSTLNGIVSLYERQYENVGKMNNRQQDVLHALELADLSSDEMAELMYELQMIRKFRRESKDFVELAEPLYAYLTSKSPVIKDLGAILETTKNTKRKHDNRTYTPREKTALEEAFERAKVKGG